MNIKEILYYVIDAFKRVNHYANCIYDSGDDDVKDIIMSICAQEIKVLEYELDEVRLEGGE